MIPHDSAADAAANMTPWENFNDAVLLQSGRSNQTTRQQQQQQQQQCIIRCHRQSDNVT